MNSCRWRIVTTVATPGVGPLALLIIVVAVTLPAASVTAQGDRRCFTETGQCIGGPIRFYWEQNGGLPVFGYPLGPQREELVEGRSVQVQWFERDRLEIQADGTLTAGRLGARYLELTGRRWIVGDSWAAGGDCRLAPETGYAVCGEIRAYWERNGGVERFGFPLTKVITELIEGRAYQVQYFERRRVELHPDLAGTPYALQLGLLGRDIATAAVCVPAVTDTLRVAVRRYLDAMGCPADEGRAGAIAWQRYERGVMYWIAAGASSPPLIFVVRNDEPAQRSTWAVFTDDYREGEAVGGEAPQGRIAPQRGFGKRWWNDPELQRALGWPVEAEQAGVGAAIAFPNGGWMFERLLPDMVVVMLPDGTAFGVKSDLLPH